MYRCKNGRKTWHARAQNFAILTVFEFLASLIRFSADLTSSRMASISEFLREFRWSCTFTQTLSIICRTEKVCYIKVNLLNFVHTGSHLLCGGGHDALLESVRLFLEVFSSFVIPVQIILNLLG